MQEFVDPRLDPQPPCRVSREPAPHGEEVRELARLCAVGHIYDVERWIKDGRPIQAVTYKRPRIASIVSPLRAAIREKSRDLVLLLLCNGYRLDLEGGDWNSILDEALSLRAFDIVDLLVRWGADPKQVDTENVIGTYKTDVIDRFWRAGVDYTASPAFARTLATTINKPLYGWLRRNRSDRRLQDALDVALLEAVVEDKEGPASLLVWAGADPHRKVPMARDLGRPDAWAEDSVFSSAEAAIVFGRHSMFDLLRVAAMSDLPVQILHAHDSATLKKLVAISAPREWSSVILAFIGHFGSPFGFSRSWDAKDALRFIEESGGRLTVVPPDRLRYLRKELVGLQRDEFLWLLRWLNREKTCDPSIYEELMRTASIRQKRDAVEAGPRYLSTSEKMARKRERRRPSHRARVAVPTSGPGN